MAEPTKPRIPCDASHQYKGGVNCDQDADHAGLHRHGVEHGGDHPVVYWSGPDDLATRAELLAEIRVLKSLHRSSARADGVRLNPGIARGPQDRLTSQTVATIETRLTLILQTLFGPNAVFAGSELAQQAVDSDMGAEENEEVGPDDEPAMGGYRPLPKRAPVGRISAETMRELREQLGLGPIPGRPPRPPPSLPGSGNPLPRRDPPRTRRGTSKPSTKPRRR